MTGPVPSGSSIEHRLTEAGLPPLPRSAWLEIDQDALAGNLRAVARLVGPGVPITAVVKSDGYGHGLEISARTFLEAGADGLAVATLDEALALRAAGVTAPILVLFSVPPAAAVEAAMAGLELVAAEEETVGQMLAAWERSGVPEAAATGVGKGRLRLHLELETGLGRAGLRREALLALGRRLAGTRGVDVVGLWSHLASADDAGISAGQAAQLEQAAVALGPGVLASAELHLAATGGLFGATVPVYGRVRPGLCLYGELPRDFPVAPRAVEAARALRPAMTLKCRPLRVESAAAGESVGYGGLWTAARPSRVATLPVGYGDGWDRAYGARREEPDRATAQALVRGCRVPLVGSVAMDAIAADVTEVPGVGLDDEFVLLGEQGDARIEASDLARLRTTISWEVLAGMAARLPRVYHSGSRIIGLRTIMGEVLASRGTSA